MNTFSIQYTRLDSGLICCTVVLTDGRNIYSYNSAKGSEFSAFREVIKQIRERNPNHLEDIAAISVAYQSITNN